MPMRSVAEYTPGKATARQSPYVVGPISGPGGGKDIFNYLTGLMERQMALKEAMAKAQLGMMQQQRLAAEQQLQMAQERAKQESAIWRKQMRAGRPQAGLTGGRRAPEAGMPTLRDWEMMSDPRNVNMPGREEAFNRVFGWLGPQAIAQMQMQKGKNWADVIRQASATAGALQGGQPQMITHQGEAGALPRISRFGQTPLFGGQMGGVPQGIPETAMAYLRQGTTGMIPGVNAEKGGRVPKTGTYKLHKGEVVLNKKQSDMMFPRGSEGEPIKSYQAGTVSGLQKQRSMQLGQPTGMIGPPQSMPMPPSPQQFDQGLGQMMQGAGAVPGAPPTQMLGPPMQQQIPPQDITGGGAQPIGPPGMMAMPPVQGAPTQMLGPPAQAAIPQRPQPGMGRQFPYQPQMQAPPQAPKRSQGRVRKSYAEGSVPESQWDLIRRGLGVFAGGIGAIPGAAMNIPSLLEEPSTAAAPIPSSPGPLVGMPGVMPGMAPRGMPIEPSPYSVTEEPISERGAAMRPGQETVKKYTMRGTPETDKERIQRLRGDADRQKEKARLQRSRANLLLTYAERQGEVDPLLKQKVQERQWLAKQYDQDAAASLQEAEDLDAKLKEVATRKEIAGTEAEGRVGAEQVKQLGSMRQFYLEKAADLPGDIVRVLVDFAKNRVEDEDAAVEAYRGQIHALLSWYKEPLRAQMDMDKEQFDELYNNYIEASVDDPTRLDVLVGMIQETLG